MNQQGQYEFYVDIDGTRVRTEYLDHAVNSIDNSYEMFTEIVYWPTRTHCVWSNDNSPAIFRDQYVKIRVACGHNIITIMPLIPLG